MSVGSRTAPFLSTLPDLGVHRIPKAIGFLVVGEVESHHKFLTEEKTNTKPSDKQLSTSYKTHKDVLVYTWNFICLSH